MSRILVHDYWRPFQPEAPVMAMSIYKNTSVDIDLRKYLVQGAHDITTGDVDGTVLTSIGVQRGWNVNLVIPKQPDHGRAQQSTVVPGINYVSNHNYVGFDCINFILNVNGQNSTFGRIELTVQDFFSVAIQPYKQTNTQTFRYVATPRIPASFGTGWTILYTWYHKKPIRTYNNTKGRYEVTTDLVQWYGSVFDGQSMNIVLQGNQTTQFTYLWPDHNLIGYIKDTDEPYVQPEGPYPLILETQFVKDPVMVNNVWTGAWGQAYITTTDLELELGTRWWELGSIILE